MQSGAVEIRVRGMQSGAEAVGLYPPNASPLPPDADEAEIWGDAALAKLVVAGYTSHETVYGIGQVEAQLVADEAGARWPFLSFACFGARALVVRYRVSILR